MKAIAGIITLILIGPNSVFANGWFLMQPPIEGRRYFPDSPLSKWEHVKSFDTAQACENYKLYAWNEYKISHETARKKAHELREQLGKKGVLSIILREGSAGLLDKKFEGIEVTDTILEAAIKYEAAVGEMDTAFALRNATFASRCIPADSILSIQRGETTKP